MIILDHLWEPSYIENKLEGKLTPPNDDDIDDDQQISIVDPTNDIYKGSLGLITTNCDEYKFKATYP